MKDIESSEVTIYTLRKWTGNRGLYLDDDELKHHMIDFCGKESITFKNFITILIADD